MLWLYPMNMMVACCCGATLVDRWRPCGQTTDVEDVFLPPSVREGLPTPDSVAQIDSLSIWRCWFLVEEGMAETPREVSGVTYYDDCEAFECECSEDLTCLQVVGDPLTMFGTVFAFVLGTCSKAGSVYAGQTLWDGKLTKVGPCTWSGGDYYRVNYPGDPNPDQVWQFTIGVIRQPTRYRMAIQFSRVTGGPVSGTVYFELIDSAPLGTWTFLPGESGPELTTVGCYVFSAPITTVEC